MKEVANRGIDNFQTTTHIKCRWKPFAQKELKGQIEFFTEAGAVKLNAEIKNNLREIHLPLLYKMAKEHPPLIVITNHLFPKLKEELRNHNIAYLEENGNIWLKHKKAFLWIEGNKALPKEKEKTNRAFTKTGLKVVFYFLLDEDLVNAKYRDIAHRTGIALGYVNPVLNGLKEKAFLLTMDKNKYKLTNKKALLDTWITQYADKLKPELEIGKFRFLKDVDFENWKQIPLKPGKTCWGAEPAGDLLSHYLKPAVLTLYTIEDKNELIKNYRLIPDPAGNVQVYKKFWDYDKVNDNLAPPLLVYADLMNTGDHRCMETAEKIYNEFFKEKF